MAGFGDDFQFNLKCVIIALIAAILYWVLPRKNLIVALLILIFVYVLISYYDVLYDCNDKLKNYNGLFSQLTKDLKPPVNPQGVYSFDKDETFNSNELDEKSSDKSNKKTN